MNTSPSTTVTFPSLSTSSAAELYAGFAYTSASAANTTNAGTSLIATSANKDLYVDNPDVSGTLAPIGAQAPAGTSSSVAATIAAGGVAGGVIAPVGTLQKGGGVGASDALEVTPQNLGDAFVLAVRVASSNNPVASVTGGDANWSLLSDYLDVVDAQDIELWMGVTSGTDPAPIVVTPGTANVSTSLVLQEFHDGAVSVATTTSTTPPVSTTTTAPTPTTTVNPTAANPTTTTSSLVAPITRVHRGTLTLSSPRIDSRQARVRWTDPGVRVSRIIAAIYTTAHCTKVAHRQLVPNARDSLASGEINFSSARGGTAANGSFSGSTVYYARIIAASGPAGPLGASRCIRVGRG